ncbi:MAG: hypothetical protein F4234_00245 [Gammaproteobacteria bacterium]|nr:hypothetical protein [Gammaproteobacteria bacterium]MYA37176.1 hypothetical protein [Gammaproteobacteria bacterium]MYE98624.1 hypothetical protein [Gammaproteobacteria bacterium]MYG95348.1 hypothetical protein [Gammaproteobacteria bacterium]MYH84268.1 hypothetical protein [Gammaproteobacteria bacterium]
MSLIVIELNDVSLQVGDAAGVAAAGPGFALLEGREVTLGAAAEQQHRIYPTSSYDKFWHELNMEPLHVRGRIRHHADLAYSQLLELAREAEIEDEVLLAVPGHYNNQQLGLLLGLASQCPFRVGGMVDSALAAASLTDKHTSGEHIVHAGLHLHQVLLTRLIRKDGELAVDNVVPVPQLGRQQLLDVLMRIANDAFIRQCRFNPQHEAASEQELYSMLAAWIGEKGDEQGNLVMELKAGAITHTAKLPRDQLLAGLQKSYDKLLRSLRPLTELPGAGILLDHRLALLPGAVAALGEAGPLQVARPEAVTEACLRHHELIAGGEGVHRIRALPDLDSPGEGAESRAGRNAPTHVLFRNRAMPVADLPLVNNLNGSGGNALEFDLPGPSTTLGRILRKQSAVMLDCGDIEFRLNDVPVKGRQPLKLGDRIRFPELADELLMIEVNDGR